MAVRPVFVPKADGSTLVDVVNVEFQWFAGMSIQQKQKSIDSLHSAYLKNHTSTARLLEISSKSKNKLGNDLSAFNLSFRTSSGLLVSVESLFQSCKVFSNGGNFKDILYKSSREAKKDERLKNSGYLKNFCYKGEQWDLEPRTSFYDWIYLNVLSLNSGFKSELLGYNAFTDIEFNPKKSINCQAYTAALFVAFQQRGLLEKDKIPEKKDFLQLIKRYEVSSASDGFLI